MATRVKTDKSFILPLGPLKLEIIPLTAVTNGDTIASRLGNPTYAVAFVAADASGTNDISASISGKTITIHDPPVTGPIIVVVFGDAIA